MVSEWHQFNQGMRAAIIAFGRSIIKQDTTNHLPPCRVPSPLLLKVISLRPMRMASLSGLLIGSGTFALWLFFRRRLIYCWCLLMRTKYSHIYTSRKLVRVRVAYSPDCRVCRRKGESVSALFNLAVERTRD